MLFNIAGLAVGILVCFIRFDTCRGVPIERIQSIANQVVATGPAPVNLGTAGTFAILAKAGVSTVPPSAISRCARLLRIRLLDSVNL